MKSSNNSSANAFLVIVGMAGIITASLFGGYKFATRNSQIDQKFTQVADEAKKTAKDKWGIEAPKIEFDFGKEEEKEAVPTFEYSVQEKRNNQEPQIFLSSKCLYNTDGKILDDFKDVTEYTLNFRPNAGHTEGFVLTDDQVLYYVSGDLELTKIYDNVTYADMCFDGGYGYFIAKEKGYHRNLYVYDAVSGESRMFAEDVYEDNVGMSPNGKLIAFSSSDPNNMGTYISDIDGNVLDTIARKSITPVAVADDASTVMYSCYADDGRFFCHTSEGETRLATKGGYVFDTYVTRDCKQLIYEFNDKTWYYRAGEKKPRKLFDNDRLNFKVCNADIKALGRYSDYYMIDSDCFANSLMLSENNAVYCLYGDDPQMVRIEKKRNTDTFYIMEGGPTVYYKNYDEGKLEKLVYDGKEIKQYSTPITVASMGNFTGNEDLSEMWIADNRGKHIIYSKNEGNPVQVADLSSYVSDMRWNQYDGKCYYICDGNLYRVGTQMGTAELVLEGVNYFQYSFDIPKSIKFRGQDEKEYYLVADTIYENTSD